MWIIATESSENPCFRNLLCVVIRVFVFTSQAMLFSSALWYYFASVFPGILNEQRPPHWSLIGLISYLIPWLLNAPDWLGSWPVQRWWKWWFTGVTIWHCRRSYKHWGRPILALFRPSSQPARFIVNYGWFWGRRSRVHSYINPLLFMGNYKTPRIFFLPPETSFEVSVRCCHFFFFNLPSCRFLEPWVICGKSSLFFLIQDICSD